MLASAKSFLTTIPTFLLPTELGRGKVLLPGRKASNERHSRVPSPKVG
jgi:hypothetical protein